MTLTEREIFSQQEALERALEAFSARREQLGAYISPEQKRYVFVGCGSSHMMAQSAARAFALEPGVSAYALAGGDYLLAPEDYRGMVEGSVVVFFSRSGATGELLRAAETMRTVCGVRILTVTMAEQSPLEALSHCTLAMPWAHDQSVCQTRSVTTFYTVILLLWALYRGDAALEEDVAKVARGSTARLESLRPALRDLTHGGFTDVVVLADGVLCGIAAEAALAFTEVCMVSGKSFHLLDYRHGPKVLGSPDTLYLLVVRPQGQQLQRDMAADVAATGGTVVLLCPREHTSGWDAGLVIPCDAARFASYGIPLIQAAQVLALERALHTGIDPDHPKGLDSFITLK